MKIKCKAMCVFRHNGSILLLQGKDSKTGAKYSRPLGGSIEFGELSSETIVREVKEEISADISDVKFLGVLENVFDFEGKKHHEIDFIYDATFNDPDYYKKETIIGEEGDGRELIAYWKKIDSFTNSDDSLVPEGLLDLITK